MEIKLTQLSVGKKEITWKMFVRFQVLTAASMMFRVVFWDILSSTIILHGSITQKTTLNMENVCLFDLKRGLI
jgi:hypothetical protein